jgi:prevent-host-death family protein
MGPKVDEVGVRHWGRVSEVSESGQRQPEINLVARGARDAYVSSGRINQSKSDVAMREVQASAAKTHLPQLLDDVEHGETIVITRHGRPIARLVPEADRRQAENAAAIEAIKALRKGRPKITVEELLSMRDEGRRY